MGSRSVTKLLTFCVDSALQGNEESLKETTIGIFCFGRTPGYDTKLDPIVRVTARRLRSKLELYYQNEQESHDLRIVLPKGTYVPRFHGRSAQTATMESLTDEMPIYPGPVLAGDVNPTPAEKVLVETQHAPIVRTSWLVPAALGLLLFSLISSGALILTYTHFHRDTKSMASQDNLAHPASVAESPTPTEAGVSNTGNQIQIPSQVLDDAPLLAAPKVAEVQGESHVQPVAITVDHMVTSVEPRL